MPQEPVDRKLTRDYPALSESPWTLWDVMLARRSCRKYSRWTPDPDLAREMADFAATACARRAAPEGSIAVVTDPDVGGELRKRSYRGFGNKINLWLSRSPVSSFLALALPSGDVSAPRPAQLPRAAMAAEDCVLWLTSRGLGTCWLGGVNSEEVRNVLGLPGGTRIPAVVCLGKPHDGAGPFTFDGMMRNALSRRRKPLEAVACLERLGVPFPYEAPPAGFRAAAVQDVQELVQSFDEPQGPGGVPPMQFVVEACLEAGRIAPSGGNYQGWNFVAVMQEERLRPLEKACGASSRWKAAVVGVGRQTRLNYLAYDKPFWMMDVPIAMSHMSLMAASMGQPARVLTDIDEPAVNKMVGAKEGARTAAVMALI